MAAKTLSSSGLKSNYIVGATLMDDPNMLVGLPDEDRASARGALAGRALFLPWIGATAGSTGTTSRSDGMGAIPARTYILLLLACLFKVFIYHFRLGSIVKTISAEYAER